MSDEMILVPRAELLAWAKAWKNAYDPNDGTDCVTPFDTYLLKSPVEAPPEAQPAPSPYNRKRIAWELERTAMGDGYYGNALYVAKEFPEATPSIRSLLDRWATGKESGLSDRIELCAFAVKIYAVEREFTPPPAEAQPVGSVVWSAGIENTMLEVEWSSGIEPPAGTKLYAHPSPSAPVGVEDLSCCGGNDETPKSHCMDCSRYPGQLAQQPAVGVGDWLIGDLMEAEEGGHTAHTPAELCGLAAKALKSLIAQQTAAVDAAMVEVASLPALWMREADEIDRLGHVVNTNSIRARASELERALAAKQGESQ